MKRIALIVTLLCVAATLVVASSTPAASPAPSGTTTAKTLTVWTWKLAYIPGFEAAAKAFEAETGIKVVFEAFTPDQTYKQKVTAAVATSTLPDILHWWGTAGPNELIGEIIDMRPNIDDAWKNQFYPVAWPAVTLSQSQMDDWKKAEDTSPAKLKMEVGTITGVPLDVGAFFLFFGNKKLIEKAGLKAEPPKTWEDFIEMMKTVQAKTGVPALTFGGKFADLWANWCGNALFVMANGPEGYGKLLKRETKMSDPENLRVLKAIEPLMANNLCQPGILNLTIDDADQAFYAGKAVFDLGGSFTMSTLMAMGMNPDDIVVFPVPPLKGSKYMEWKINPFTLTMMSINNKGKNQKEAMQFVKFLCSEKGAALFAKNAYDIPAFDLGKTASKDQLPTSVKLMLGSFSSAPDYFSQIADIYPRYFWDHKEWRIHDEMVGQLFAGKATAEDVAKAFDQAMEAEKAAEGK